MWNAVGDLTPLLEPQERFGELNAATIRRFGRRVIDLSYPNPYDGPCERVRRALQFAAMEERELGFQYTPYGGRTTTRRRIAAELARQHGLRFEYRDVVMTPGAMAALNVALRALFGPQDEVLLPLPCWFDYPLYLRNLGIPFRMVARTSDKHLDVEAIERAVGPRTRGILFSQPCCPTGVLHSADEIRALARVLFRAQRRYGAPITIISDEVHSQLIWSGRPFHSPLREYPRTLQVYSFGKPLFLQGQRIGHVAVSPRMPGRDAVRSRLERCVRLMGFCTPTTLMQRALPRLLGIPAPIDAIAARQRTVRLALTSAGYDVCDGDASFFVYVRSPLEDDFRFAELLAGDGVLVLPSTLFHEPGYFRISVTPRPEALDAAMPILEQALRRLAPVATCTISA